VPEPGPAHQARTVYDEIMAQTDNDNELVPLCPLVRTTFFDGMGLYTVEALTGFYEEYVSEPGRFGGVTYVQLALVDAWFMAEQIPVARIRGGPGPNGGGAGWDFTLTVGETIGLLLTDARPENRGYYGLFELGVFKRREDGGYSNGQLFTQRVVDEQELGRLVKGLAGGAKEDPCPYDEAPDVYAVPPTPTNPNEDQPTDVPQPSRSAADAGT
jgi:hypothetical protein